MNDVTPCGTSPMLSDTNRIVSRVNEEQPTKGARGPVPRELCPRHASVTANIKFGFCCVFSPTVSPSIARNFRGRIKNRRLSRARCDVGLIHSRRTFGRSLRLHVEGVHRNFESVSFHLSQSVLSYFDDPNLIGTHTHCLLTEQPACRRPITVAAVRRARVLGIRSAVRVIATT